MRTNPVALAVPPRTCEPANSTENRKPQESFSGNEPCSGLADLLSKTSLDSNNNHPAGGGGGAAGDGFLFTPGSQRSRGGGGSSAYNSRMGGGGDRSFSFGGAETPRTPRETATAPPGGASSPRGWRGEAASGGAGFAPGAGMEFSTPAAFRRPGGAGAEDRGIFDGLGEEDLSFGAGAGSSFGGGSPSGAQR